MKDGAISEALQQVRTLQRHILEKQQFKSYPGRARALGGVVALIGTLIIWSQPGWIHGPTIFAAWFVGGLLSAALIRSGQWDLLPGTWLAFYGLAQFSTRHVLPRAVTWVGIYYLAAGGIGLMWPPNWVEQPCWLGLIFFGGEFMDGLVFHFDGSTRPTWAGFFGWPERQNSWQS